MEGSAKNAAAAAARAAYFGLGKEISKGQARTASPMGEKDTKENVVSAINEKIAADRQEYWFTPPPNYLPTTKHCRRKVHTAFEQARNSTFRDLSLNEDVASRIRTSFQTPFWGALES